MGFCPADCATNELVVNQVGGCDLEVRQKTISKIGFFVCDTALPSPFTCNALQALITANVLTFSSPLANVQPQAPTFTDLLVADCLPTRQLTDTREIQFQDRIAITGSTGSPATDVPYFEQEFWQDKLDLQTRLRFMIVFCDGSVVVARKQDGSYMEGSVTAYIDYEGTGADNRYQFINGILKIKGDPLALFNKPELNAGGETVFNINDCTF